MIRIEVETKKLLYRLEQLRLKAVPYAVAMAMTWTSKQAAEAVKQEVDKKIDAPTPLTQRSSRYKVANKERTEYDVYIQDEASKGVPPSKYLRPLFEGGYRANKRSENQLRRKGMLPPGWQMYPGADQLDRYGNLRGGGGRYVQILSGLEAFQERGFQMNRTAASGKRKGNTQREYFILYSVKTKTPIGIYTRSGRGGRDVKQILAFTPKRARYTKLFDFKGIINRVFRERFDANFQEALRRMLEKVKSW